MRKNWQLFFCSIFLIVGLVFLVAAGLNGFESWRMIRQGKVISGNVARMIESQDSDGGSTYRPQVSYVDDNGITKSWTPNSASRPPCCKVGEQITLLIDPADPKHILINKFGQLWSISLIFGGMGLLVTLIGGIVALAFIKHKRNDEWLKNFGQRIEADFSTIGRGNIEVNGQKPWVVICQWKNPANGEMIIFKSDYIWFDPSSYLTSGQKIGVLIDPNNIKRYHVDLSFLST